MGDGSVRKQLQTQGDLSSDPWFQPENLGVAVHTSEPSAGELKRMQPGHHWNVLATAPAEKQQAPGSGRDSMTEKTEWERTLSVLLCVLYLRARVHTLRMPIHVSNTYTHGHTHTHIQKL